MISMICNGITFGDTDKMSYYDRMFVFKELKKIKEDEAEALKEARRG